jgi:hypothetical protein
MRNPWTACHYNSPEFNCFHVAGELRCMSNGTHSSSSRLPTPSKIWG